MTICHKVRNIKRNTMVFIFSKSNSWILTAYGEILVFRNKHQPWAGTWAWLFLKSSQTRKRYNKILQAPSCQQKHMFHIFLYFHLYIFIFAKTEGKSNVSIIFFAGSRHSIPYDVAGGLLAGTLPWITCAGSLPREGVIMLIGLMGARGGPPTAA